jgi:uncharacterized glyoxalase superfamily protein PhnB
MRFRYSCIIVKDVPATVAFYEKAFGFALRYMHPTKGYAELDTGATLLSFFGEAFIANNTLLGKHPWRPIRPGEGPTTALLAFDTDSLEQDWQRAIAAGAMVVTEPEPKPWQQTVGYLRDPDGIVIELCTTSPRP